MTQNMDSFRGNHQHHGGQRVDFPPLNGKPHGDHESNSSGWWLTYPSEKYESMGRMTMTSHIIMDNKKVFQTTNQSFQIKYTNGSSPIASLNMTNVIHNWISLDVHLPEFGVVWSGSMPIPRFTQTLTTCWW